MLRSANASRSLAAGDIAGRPKLSAAASNSLCSSANRCSVGAMRRGQFDVLLGQHVEPGRGVDHQIPQLLERLGL